jgi:N-acetyl sugar amidotransferase
MAFQICTKCVLEASTLANLSFDANGVCNMCNSYDAFVRKIDANNWPNRKTELDKIVSDIKKSGNKKQYDCILGLSGGFDSTYLAYLTKELGLRPLVVHFDNGWNSELAVQNVYNVVNKLGLDLHTYVINWEEFKDLQLAYLKASVIDIEIPTDHFIYATLYQIASQKRIKYILDGNNFATEYGNLSMKWSYSKIDLANLLDIHKKFGTIPLKKFPKLGLYHRLYYDKILKIKTVRLSDYIPVDKTKAIKVLETELDWRDPGGKHYESIYTRFYQGYILPNKFKVDKRRLHYSNLIWSGQLDRETALNMLNNPTYDLKKQEEDKAYVLKKFNLSENDFQALMNNPVKSHESFKTENQKHIILIGIINLYLKMKNAISNHNSPEIN